MSTVTWPAGQADPVASILDQLQTVLTDALNGTTAQAPARVEIAYGTRPTFDEADMAWVMPLQVYPSQEAFGQQDARYTPRKQPFRWAVDVEVGVIRCGAVIGSADNRAVVPAGSAITAVSATVLEDARAIRAVAQFLHPWRGDVLQGKWQPIGPQGGVAGGAIQMTVPFADCKPTVT